jgi:CBS domain-containing protein
MGIKHISEIMTTKLHTVRPDATIEEAAQIMAEQDIGWLPVVNHEHRLLGALTDRDLVLRALAKAKDVDTKVEQVMTMGVIAAQTDQSVEQVARLMQDNQIRRIAIVDQELKPVGVISLADLAQRTRDERVVYTTTDQVAAPPPTS